MDLLQEFMEDDDTEVLIQKFHQDMNEDQRLEFMVILEKMLWFGPSSSMKRFVSILLNQCEIPTGIKCRMAEQVYDADDPDYVKKIREWITKPDMEAACRIEWIEKIHFYEHYTLEEIVNDWITHVFLLPEISESPLFRFRTLLQALTMYENFSFETFVAIANAYRSHFDDPVMNKILLTENLLKKDDKEGEPLPLLIDCLDELLQILNEGICSLEEQADICDFFLHTDYPRILPEMRTKAQQVMAILFQENMTSHLSIFANRQNVHNESIEKSSEEILETLIKKYCTVVKTPSLLAEWKSEVEKWECYKKFTESQQDKITLCFHRIQFDQRVYGKTGNSLLSIFALVWKHIHKSSHTEELQKRLCEEMLEASGQCSSGIAVRLLNTLSGFDDFMLRISYRDSILAKVVAHMNRVIIETEDETTRDALLEEMILPNSDYLERKNFLSLFRQEIPKIKEQLYTEYKDDMNDTDFDLYLKQALVHYEGQN